jgi:hypothetical protein
MGLDCYRTWEAIYLGSYVVVRSLSLDPSYAGLPILVVREWEEVTESLLEQAYDLFRKQRFDYRPLFIEHWRREIYAWKERPHVRFEYQVQVRTVPEN